MSVHTLAAETTQNNKLKMTRTFPNDFREMLLKPTPCIVNCSLLSRPRVMVGQFYHKALKLLINSTNTLHENNYKYHSNISSLVC